MMDDKVGEGEHFNITPQTLALSGSVQPLIFNYVRLTKCRAIFSLYCHSSWQAEQFLKMASSSDIFD